MAAIADDGAESSLCNRGPSSLWNESFIVSCRATAACANRPAESGFEYGRVEDAYACPRIPTGRRH